jgi:quercetin dioxygenase-like cupin family protein
MERNLSEPRVVSFRADEFAREIVPGVAHMKHLFGNSTSVALFKIAKGRGTSFPDRPHQHGEEVAIQLRGSSTVTANGKEYTIKEGELIIMPAGLSHSGIFSNDEECWLLAVCTPPREDYGAETW